MANILGNLLKLGGFSPSQIAGMQVWYKADFIPGLVDGDPIATWPDKGINSFNLSASGVARPTLKTGILNGKPVARFDGAGNIMVTANSTSPLVAQPTSVFIVARMNATNDVLFDAVTNLTHQVDRPSAPGSFRMYAGNTLEDTNDDGNFHLFMFNFNGASSRMYIDGFFTVTGNPGAGALAGITLGNRGTPGPYYLDGDIAEMIVYNSTLSGTDRDRIFDYLANRYGFTIPDLIVFDGDSLTSGWNLPSPETQCYPAQVVALYAPIPLHSYNFGVPGQYIDAMIADGFAQIDSLLFTGKKNVLCVWGGGNNIALGGQTAATIYPKLVTYNTARKNAGFSVVQLTFPPRVDITAGFWDNERLTLNALIINNGASADYIADIATAPELQDFNDLTYFQADKIHLNVTGYAVVAALVKQQLDNIL